MIIRKGQRHNPFYVIREGLCRVSIPDRSGQEIVLDDIGPGMCFGEMSKITQNSASANVRAECDVTLWAMDTKAFDEVLGNIPAIGRKVYNELCCRLDNMNENLKQKVNQLLELNENLEHQVADQVKDLQKKNQQLEEQNNEMIRLSQLRDDFLNMAVHDLRSPLTNIMGFLELLHEDSAIKSQDHLLEMINIIDRQSEAMLSLINDLLDISKIQSGQLNMQMCNLHASTMIAEAIQANTILAKAKGIDLVNDTPAGCNWTTLGDQRRLAEIFNNLITNAIKFSPRDSHIWIGCELLDSRIKFFIRDEGVGIPEHELPKLFAAFQQLSPKSTEGERGTGLGLAIVDKLVHLHGGEVNVESKLGEGSIFSFTLPSRQH